ncbi:endolytic transglycosylase MltG [Priestia endophytica]|uniref:endolytic transglycosylase MltG n=1 Tax=Priestia endophytica TaxID=135735 RepID=UPI000F54806B|nr:endolytic transglycosylase MltG [Priestia endophytica]
MQQQNEAKKVRKAVLWVLSILFVLFVGLALGLYIYIHSALSPVDEENKKEIIVSVPTGSTVSTIAHTLEDKDLIKNATVFRYYAKFSNLNDFQAGNYEFTQAMSPKEMINRLQEGKVSNKATVKITVPEGRQLDEISALISKETKFSKEEIEQKLEDKAFINNMKKKYPDLVTSEVDNPNIKQPLEGYLYPATYSFYKKDVPLEEILEAMIEKTNNVIAPYQSEIKKQKTTVHKILTMASLVEEEATDQTDRKKIASVFYNRLEKDMRLQTDPTVLYSLGSHKDRVLYKDLEVKSPYNTYKVKGLTPGPISNAGKESIEAALFPEQTDYVYFLATESGEVIFTKTLEEHNKEKEKHITEERFQK